MRPEAVCVRDQEHTRGSLWLVSLASAMIFQDAKLFFLINRMINKYTVDWDYNVNSTLIKYETENTKTLFSFYFFFHNLIFLSCCLTFS